MIHFSCKWCGKRYHAPARFAGRSEACKDCGKPVFVPKASNAQGPTLQFSCPRCGKHYRTRLRFAGVKQTCRKCGETIVAPERPGVPAAGPGNTGVAPVESPFEIEPTTEAQKLAHLEAFLDLPPFELVPAADELPDAPFVDDDDDDDVPAAPLPGAAAPPPPVPPPVAALAPPPPVATYVPPPPQAVYVPPPQAVYVPPPQAVYVPPAPPPAPPPRAVAVPPPPASPPPPPPPAPRMEDLLEAPLVESEPSLDLPPAKPDPPPKPKGCPHCGGQGSYNLHARSPLGVLAMLLGTFGGLGALCFVEQDWRYGIPAGVGFLVAIIGAFLKRWTVICSGCERRLY